MTRRYVHAKRLKTPGLHREGFRQGFKSCRDQRVIPTIIEHDRTAAGIRTQLDRVLRADAPPTGLFVAHPQDVLTVLSCLMRRRLRVPEDVALISRQGDPPC